MKLLSLLAQLLSLLIFGLLVTALGLMLLYRYSSPDTAGSDWQVYKEARNGLVEQADGRIVDGRRRDDRTGPGPARQWLRPTAVPTAAQPQLAYSQILRQPLDRFKAPGAVLYVLPVDSGEDSSHSQPGRILWQRDAQTPRPTASMTKLMSLLLVQEFLRERGIDINELCRVPPGGAAEQRPIDAAVAGLKEGQELSWAELLSYAIVASANDAIYALAILVGQELGQKSGQKLEPAPAGNRPVQSFVAQMNRRAGELQLKTAYFVDPDGWSEEDRISPLDMARLAAFYSARFPEALVWHRLGQVEIDGRIKYNTNLLLPYYPELEGLKTGFTYEAGFNFTATARRDNRRYIAVVMGLSASDIRQGLRRRAAEAEALLDWGLKNFVPLLPSVSPESSETSGIRSGGGEIVSQVVPRLLEGSSAAPFDRGSLSRKLSDLQQRLRPLLQTFLLWQPKSTGLTLAGTQPPPDLVATEVTWRVYWEEELLYPPHFSEAFGPVAGYVELLHRGRPQARFALQGQTPPELSGGNLLLLQLRSLLAELLWPLLRATGYSVGLRPFGLVEKSFRLE
ncbi:serine hydrolase [Candidatus Haliotispira prima]|uniref:Serine hydrolase n=1 Tax=Candidatus Haliotispira prima TaxID=3034016 RepID=A0ABY8MGM7_9SPIO|nr:serine hydrolase [Candidatus Haliotispira prima]